MSHILYYLYQYLVHHVTRCVQDVAIYNARTGEIYGIIQQLADFFAITNAPVGVVAATGEYFDPRCKSLASSIADSGLLLTGMNMLGDTLVQVFSTPQPAR